MTLMEMLIKEGYPKEEFFHHYSDLYIFATPMTQRVVNQWCKDNGYHRDLFVSRAARIKQRIKDHWRDYRPSNEEWAEIMREHRHYKQSLYLNGELKEVEENGIPKKDS